MEEERKEGEPEYVEHNYPLCFRRGVVEKEQSVPCAACKRSAYHGGKQVQGHQNAIYDDDSDKDPLECKSGLEYDALFSREHVGSSNKHAAQDNEEESYTKHRIGHTEELALGRIDFPIFEGREVEKDCERRSANAERHADLLEKKEGQSYKFHENL
jgi:hypothetical protein